MPHHFKCIESTSGIAYRHVPVKNHQRQAACRSRPTDTAGERGSSAAPDRPGRNEAKSRVDSQSHGPFSTAGPFAKRFCSFFLGRRGFHRSVLLQTPCLGLPAIPAFGHHGQAILQALVFAAAPPCTRPSTNVTDSDGREGSNLCMGLRNDSTVGVPIPPCNVSKSEAIHLDTEKTHLNGTEIAKEDQIPFLENSGLFHQTIAKLCGDATLSATIMLRSC